MHVEAQREGVEGCYDVVRNDHCQSRLVLLGLETEPVETSYSEVDEAWLCQAAIVLWARH
jgi:hypothetical protein